MVSVGRSIYSSLTHPPAAACARAIRREGESRGGGLSNQSDRCVGLTCVLIGYKVRSLQASASDNTLTRNADHLKLAAAQKIFSQIPIVGKLKGGFGSALNLHLTKFYEVVLNAMLHFVMPTFYENVTSKNERYLHY